MNIIPLSFKDITRLDTVLNDELAIENLKQVVVNQTTDFPHMNQMLVAWSKKIHSKPQTNLMNIPVIKCESLLNNIQNNPNLTPNIDYDLLVNIGGLKDTLEYREYETLEPFELAHFDENEHQVFLHVGVIANYHSFYRILIEELGYQGFFNFVLSHEIGHGVSFGLMTKTGSFFSECVPQAKELFTIIRPWDILVENSEYKYNICESFADLYAAWVLKNTYKESHDIIKTIAALREDTNLYGYKTHAALSQFLKQSHEMTTFEEFYSSATRIILTNFMEQIAHDLKHNFSHAVSQIQSWDFKEEMLLTEKIQYLEKIASSIQVEFNIKLNISDNQFFSKYHEELIEKMLNLEHNDSRYLTYLEEVKEIEKMALSQSSLNPFK